MTNTAASPTTRSSHSSRNSSSEPLLSVRDLRVTFQRQGQDPFEAVQGLNFDVRPGQTVGLVGESGCGKSVTSLAIMGLLPDRGNKVSGTVMYDGTDLLYPAMNKRFPLNSEAAVKGAAQAILDRTEKVLWMKTTYMPRTRDLSESRRKLLRAWCKKVAPPTP